jgi:inner membrane protein
MTVSGFFTKPDLTGLSEHITEIRWNEAEIAVGLSSTQAIRDVSALKLAGEKLKFLPGTGKVNVLPTGFSCRSDVSSFREGEPIEFSFQVAVGGSGRLSMVPVGVTNQFSLASEWPHPKFTGSGLPSFREITGQGFSAEWNIPNLVRNYPQLDDLENWKQGTLSRENEYAPHNLTEYVASVEFFEPVSHYSLLMRAVKYAVLFITLTCLGVLIFENYSFQKNKTKLAILQYGVIGLGLSMFYLTLLALSEHVGFTRAYLIAAVINISMTAAYVGAALKRSQPALMMVVGQGALYVLLFFILRMEDHSLLAGSAILLIAIAALMRVTRNLNQPENLPAGEIP